jgi:hypothetical protein
MLTKSLRSRWFLLLNLLTLVVMLGVLSVTPDTVQAGGLCDNGCICDTGCVNWQANYGCIEYMTCCSNSSGGWACVQHNLSQ